jgi:nuclear transport factor 2 (NTF2) superfamily protein
MWEFDTDGYMRRREASINDVPIAVCQRTLLGPRERRPIPRGAQP